MGAKLRINSERFGLSLKFLRKMKSGKMKRNKKRQADYITPLRPDTLAAFPPWGIDQELVV